MYTQSSPVARHVQLWRKHHRTLKVLMLLSLVYGIVNYGFLVVHSVPGGREVSQLLGRYSWKELLGLVVLAACGVHVLRTTVKTSQRRREARAADRLDARAERVRLQAQQRMQQLAAEREAAERQRATRAAQVAAAEAEQAAAAKAERSASSDPAQARAEHYARLQQLADEAAQRRAAEAAARAAAAAAASATAAARSAAPPPASPADANAPAARPAAAAVPGAGPQQPAGGGLKAITNERQEAAPAAAAAASARAAQASTASPAPVAAPGPSATTAAPAATSAATAPQRQAQRTRDANGMIPIEVAAEAEARQQQWLQQLSQLVNPTMAQAVELTQQRAIRQQQDEEYHASLSADQARAAREAAEEEAQKAQARRLLELRALKLRLRAALPAEAPAAGAAGAEASQLQEEGQQQGSGQQAAEGSDGVSNESSATAVVTVKVRLPDGSSHARRWLGGTPLEQVYHWVQSLEAFPLWEPESWRLSRSYPRDLLLPLSEAATVSLGQVCGSDPNLALLVEKL